MIDTPGYRILKADQPNGYAAASLFAGAGGMALGLENAGFTHVMLNEADKHAVATLRANRPDWNVVAGDMRGIDFTPLRGQVDLLEGGFPCQAFSIAGRRRGFRDPRGMMFYEFARAVEEIRPRVALAENVRGLLSHDGGLTFTLMIAVLQVLGYQVAAQLLRSQYYDVPQKRERVLVMAVRKDLGCPPLYPRERGYTVSVRQALAGCPLSAGASYTAETRQLLEDVPAGGNWKDLPDAIRQDYVGRYFPRGATVGVARRLAWDEPAPTLLCNPSERRTQRCHPSETRPLTVREYARIQTFPDEWTFAGGLAAQYQQIGNAVPVNLAYHLGRAVTAMLSGEAIEEHDQADVLPPAVGDV